MRGASSALNQSANSTTLSFRTGGTRDYDSSIVTLGQLRDVYNTLQFVERARSSDGSVQMALSSIQLSSMQPVPSVPSVISPRQVIRVRSEPAPRTTTTKSPRLSPEPSTPGMNTDPMERLAKYRKQMARAAEEEEEATPN